jgi:hypothetical protein
MLCKDYKFNLFPIKIPLHAKGHWYINSFETGK